MNTTLHKTPQEFLRAAQGPLEANEVANNLILSLAMRIAGSDKPPDPSPVLVTVEHGHRLAAAALMTPPWPAVLYAAGDALEDVLNPIAGAMAASGAQVSGCVGPKPVSDRFAKIWSSRTGNPAALKVALRLYELRTLIPPAPVAGRARLATADDVPLLAEWTAQFAFEAMGKRDNPQAALTGAQQTVDAGRMLVWEDAGQAVSMAAAQRPTRHCMSIGRVYTPREHRRRGYATACVADLTRRQLDAGWRACCLFTDLANATSNAIYQKIGYRPVADSNEYEFASPAPAVQPGKQEGQ